MKSIIVMKYSLKTTSILRCSDIHNQMILCNKTRLKKVRFLVDADYLITLLPSTQNTMYLNSITLNRVLPSTVN